MSKQHCRMLQVERFFRQSLNKLNVFNLFNLFHEKLVQYCCYFCNKVECCFDIVERCVDIVAGVDGALKTLSKVRRMLAWMGLRLAGSKHHKGNDLPCMEPRCPCEIFFYLLRWKIAFERLATASEVTTIWRYTNVYIIIIIIINDLQVQGYSRPSKMARLDIQCDVTGAWNPLCPR